MKHLITLQDWSAGEIQALLTLAWDVKANPGYFGDTMARKTLLMLFEKPSLRTRVSFETGMTQMGGHAIFYDLSQSPLGAGKETVQDTAKTVSRFVDVIMARVFEHERVCELAEHASIPVINALSDFNHPCQILADLFTINEVCGPLDGRTLTFLGDGNNNVTHSLLFGCAKSGINIRVACPEGAEFSPAEDIVTEAAEYAREAGSTVEVFHDAHDAVRGTHVVYTDSWMSYHIPPEQTEARIQKFKPFQVTEALMKEADSSAVFMNCLPAMRGYEQTAGVIDGPQSVVFEQAENRLHVQKAVIIHLLKNR